MIAGSDPNRINIRIQNEKIWKDFHAQSTEMVVTKNGRKLFPRLQYSISGLEPKKQYLVELHFEFADNKKYKYKELSWVLTESYEPTTATPKVCHQDGWQNGDVWMQCGIKFDRIKITNNSEDPRGNVLLQSMRKYQPVILVYAKETVMEQVNNFFVPQEVPVKVYQFSSKLQEFIAVTAYQNQKITALKISNNPYAKGFREGCSDKRKRSLSSTGSTPSPDVKRYFETGSSPSTSFSERPVSLQFSPLTAYQQPAMYQQPPMYPYPTYPRPVDVSTVSPVAYPSQPFSVPYAYQPNAVNYHQWHYSNMWNRNFGYQPSAVVPSTSFTNQGSAQPSSEFHGSAHPSNGDFKPES